MKLRPLMFAAITLFAAFTTSVQLAAQEQNQRPPLYTVRDLGTLGGTIGFAFAVNNRGSVVGSATLPGDTEGHAFFWSKGRTSDLGTLGGPNSGASSLNDRGEVTGSSDTSTPDPLGEDFCGFGTYLICLPLVWQKGVPTPLPTLGGNNGVTHQVNSRGQVVGQAENSTPDPTCEAPSILQFKPVVWEKGEIQELPTIGGDPDGIASAINDKGQVVGNSGDCENIFFHAVLWDHGTAIDLGTLGDLQLGPAAINNRGQIVGSAFSSSVFVAFLWQNGVATELGTLAPDVFSFASGINDKGQIVGGSCDQDFDCRAFLWQDGTMTDLNTLVRHNTPFLENGNSINSRGQIAGTTGGEGAPFLATPSHGEVVGENAAPAVTPGPVQGRGLFYLTTFAGYFDSEWALAFTFQLPECHGTSLSKIEAGLCVNILILSYSRRQGASPRIGPDRLKLSFQFCKFLFRRTWIAFVSFRNVRGLMVFLPFLKFMIAERAIPDLRDSSLLENCFAWVRI